MRLTLARHLVTEIRFGTPTRLDGTQLQVDADELQSLLLADRRLKSVDLDRVSPGQFCRAGLVFDVIEPRAKEPSDGVDFPGILGPQAVAGQGTTHVLAGAALTVLDEGSRFTPGDLVGRILEMSGPAGERSPFSKLHHLIVVPHAQPGLEREAVQHVLRIATLKAAVYLAQAAFGHEPQTTEVFDLEEHLSADRAGLPRVAYIGQIYAHQHVAALDEPILYGHNTAGMLPVPLHPNEWLDGALVAPYGAAETYFFQNHPVVLELYRRHKLGDLNFVGTIATVAASREEDRDRNAMLAAHLARWNLGAQGAVLTKYGGGAPHMDMALTARACERLGIRTVVQVSDMTRDRRVESALLFNFPEVDAIVSGGGNDTRWVVPTVERVIAGNAALAEMLAVSQELMAANICGVINQQGAQRLQGVVY